MNLVMVLTVYQWILSWFQSFINWSCYGLNHLSKKLVMVSIIYQLNLSWFQSFINETCHGFNCLSMNLVMVSVVYQLIFLSGSSDYTPSFDSEDTTGSAVNYNNYSTHRAQCRTDIKPDQKTYHDKIIPWPEQGVWCSVVMKHDSFFFLFL